MVSRLPCPSGRSNKSPIFVSKIKIKMGYDFWHEVIRFVLGMLWLLAKLEELIWAKMEEQLYYQDTWSHICDHIYRDFYGSFPIDSDDETPFIWKMKGMSVLFQRNWYKRWMYIYKLHQGFTWATSGGSQPLTFGTRVKTKLEVRFTRLRKTD